MEGTKRHSASQLFAMIEDQVLGQRSTQLASLQFCATTVKKTRGSRRTRAALDLK